MAAIGGGSSDKSLKMPLMETLRQAWADPELRQRIMFVLFMFGAFALGVNIGIPIRGYTAEELTKTLIDANPFLSIVDTFGGGALRRLSIFALGLNPYITASIVMQIVTTANPKWKKEMQEGGQYARTQQNKRTKLLTIILCVGQSLGLLQMIGAAVPIGTFEKVYITIFWMAGSMFMLWLGEQISERGIGNGVSLMIFAGIMISLPNQLAGISQGVSDGVINWFQIALFLALFFVITWLIVMFTTAQRRIPIQHMRRMIGTKMMGGQGSHLPLSLNLAGVIPIIFAVSLAYLPMQFANYFPVGSGARSFLEQVGAFMAPGAPFPQGLVGAVIYTLLILFFTYFYTAIQYNVDDIADNLKRQNSFIPGVRPGKQTRDFLDGVISRLTIVGAGFLALVALIQSLAPAITGIQNTGYFFGTSLLILVSVALETMRQIEANLLMKQYGS